MTEKPFLPKISVVIPALNEEKGIVGVIKSCLEFAAEVLVVDGGSTDRTAELARAAGAKVILETRRGYGLALLTGFEAASSEIIATADGDGTYPTDMIVGFAKKLKEGNLEFISGCRFPLKSSKAMHLSNLIGNKVLSVIGSILWFHNFKDILSGFWVFRKNSLKELKLHSWRWDLSQEIKIEAHAKFGNKFIELPINYFERVGTSKLVPWQVGIENLAYFFFHRFGLRKILTKRNPYPSQIENKTQKLAG